MHKYTEARTYTPTHRHIYTLLYFCVSSCFLLSYLFLHFQIIHSYTFVGRNLSGCPSFGASREEVVPGDVCATGSLSHGTYSQYQLISDKNTLEAARRANRKCASVPQSIRTSDYSNAGGIVSMIFASIVILLALATLVILFLRRHTPIVATTNAVFIYMHLSGIIIGTACVYPWAYGPSDVSCVLVPLLGGIGFALSFGALLSKFIRIQRILRNTSLVSVPISTKVHRAHHFVVLI